MSTKQTPSLVLGKVSRPRDAATHEGRQKGLYFVRIAGKFLRLRISSRTALYQYLETGKRYAVAYVSDGYAETVTLIVHNPTPTKFFHLQSRQENGSLPTKEVWKRKAKKKNP